jgi:hypothetical protein
MRMLYEEALVKELFVADVDGRMWEGYKSYLSNIPPFRCS